MEIKTKLLLSSFFHDIGKFQQRSLPFNEREGISHPTFSSGFVNTLFKDNLINTLVANHHEKDIRENKLDGLTKIYADIICEADNLSSGERKPDKTVTKQQPLESIFTKVDFDIDNEKPVYFQTLVDLMFDSYKFPIKNDIFKEKNENFESNYSLWWSKFYKEISTIDKNEIETLINVSKKYLWCIPSSSWQTSSDVSLFEHSKITAAITICMYNYLLENFGADENIKQIADRSEQRYLLLLADVTGIQKYIYNIGHKGASKALKGRSFFLQQLLDNIAFWILDKKFNLPITNLIYSSGGKFYILAPNTAFINDTLENIQSELEQRFMKEYDGELGVVIGKLPLSGIDLEYDRNKKEHLISEKWDRLNKIVEQNKRHKFSANWKYDYFFPTGTDGDIIRCSTTGKELIKKSDLLHITPEESNISTTHKFLKYSFQQGIFYEIINNEGLPSGEFISQEQFNSQKIGLALKNTAISLIVTDQNADYSTLDIGSFSVQKGLHFENKYNTEIARHFLINDLNISSLKGKSNKGYKYYGGDWRLPDTYEELITKGSGVERLAVLRIDVDNLGKIFKEGLGTQATFGRVVQLSSMLDFFFSCYLNKLKTLHWSVTDGVIDKPSNVKVKDLIEIVYSGGDDVFIVGHWSLLPDVAIWINNEFKKFTCFNPNFTLSAGIYLFDDKYPIYKAALEAGKNESIAKHKERKNSNNTSSSHKDGICFLDLKTPLSWSDFEKIRSHVKSFYEWIEIGIPNEKGEFKKISKGLITRLYSIYNEYVDGERKDWAKWRWRACYSLNRLGRQYSIYEKQLKNFSAELFISTTEQDFIKLLNIIATWTDLLTRKRSDLE
ncbi:MAG: putative hydrolase [Ignavibacteria bacterium]|nr:MAG: putative hydrolase [Ignavibacteria bacterium]KAF0158109.1 MAG: putative hydrolase [Ignavibacteria bacterium]